MRSLWSKLLLGFVLAASAVSGMAPARADDYWDGHWRWYDNSYRPYYQRHYYRNPYYGSGYRYNGPSPYYGRRYYYSSDPYYQRGGGAQIGPLRFGWW